MLKSSFNKTNVMVVAGGPWQVPLIKYFKDKKHTVYVVDPYLNSPGVALSDHHIQCDVKDVDKIIELAKDISFEFITTDQSDIAVNTVSKLNEFFKLPGNTYEITNKFVNKIEMRELAKSQKIPIPTFTKIYSSKQLLLFIKENGLPIIIKPADSQSSRGVYKIDESNVDSIEYLVENSLNYSSCGYLIAEDFIQGVEVTVEGFASNNKHRVTAVSLKKHFRTGIASDLEYPADISPNIYQDLEKFTDQFVENSGLIYGITHAEYLIDLKKDKPYLVEIACRGGGTLISSDIVKWVSGIDIYNLFYRNLKGCITELKDLNIKRRPALLKFFEFPPGKVRAINGVKQVEEIEGIYTFNLEFTVGDTLSNALDDRTRHGFFIAFADDKKDFTRIIEKVKNTLHIEYE